MADFRIITHSVSYRQDFNCPLHNNCREGSIAYFIQRKGLLGWRRCYTHRANAYESKFAYHAFKTEEDAENNLRLHVMNMVDGTEKNGNVVAEFSFTKKALREGIR